MAIPRARPICAHIAEKSLFFSESGYNARFSMPLFALFAGFAAMLAAGFESENPNPINSREINMVKIRLSRGGAKGRPFYHIIVADERKARDGRNIERVGFFNPVAAGKETRLQLDVERVNGWIAKGAQPSDKVRVLLKEAGKQAQAKAAV
jgi:small subunit ribosomal protein S16